MGARWIVLLVNFKESAPPCENDCICPFSSACYGRKWHEMLGKTIKKCGALAGQTGGGGVQRQMCNKGQRTRLRRSIWSQCQPRIRALCTASDWQLACGLDYTLEWWRLNKGNAWREAEETHRAENQFITLSVRGRTGRQDRDTATEEENGHRGEIKVENERY